MYPTTNYKYFVELFYDEQRADEDCGIADFEAVLDRMFDWHEQTDDNRWAASITFGPHDFKMLAWALNKEVKFGVVGLAEWAVI